MAMDNERAWVADGASVAAYDMRDPALPIQLAAPYRVNIAAAIAAMAVDEGWGHVLDATGMLTTLDLRDPADPRTASDIDLGPHGRVALATDGQDLWAAWTVAGRPLEGVLALLDVTDPTRPEERMRAAFGFAPIAGNTPAFDLSAADGEVLLTSDGAVTSWRVTTPVTTPLPWEPAVRIHMPLVTKNHRLADR